MTHSIQKSFFTSGRLYNKRYYPGNFYQVVINTEDGESYEYEIEADSFAEATRVAEDFANDLSTNITYIEIYNEEYYNK